MTYLLDPVDEIKAVAPDNTRIEHAFINALAAWDDLQEQVITGRLMHAKIRKFTRHWEGDGVGTKALDPQYAVDMRRWISDIVQQMNPLMHRVAKSAMRDASRDMVSSGVVDMMHERGLGNPSGRSPLMRVFGTTTTADKAATDLLRPLQGVVTDAARRHSKRVMDKIREMDSNGASITQIQQAIRNMIGQRSSWRQQLARYLTTSITESAKGSAWGQAGNLVTKRWVTRDDEKVRPTHRAVDGAVRALGKRFRVGASWMQAPGDPAGSIGETINCRCHLEYDIHPRYVESKAIVRDLHFRGPRGYELGETIGSQRLALRLPHTLHPTKGVVK